MSRPLPLIPEQRHQTVLALLRREGALSTRELTARLGVSHMTVRRDIALLERNGEVVSVPGGVRLAEQKGRTPPSPRLQRVDLELPRKRAIARQAAELVTDGMAIFLDAGTTCQAIIPELLTRRNLTIFTNDFHTVIALLDHKQIETIHVGGTVDGESGSSMGALPAALLRDIKLDLNFLSTGAWSLEAGVTTTVQEKWEMKRAALVSAARTVLLADSTKYGAVSRFRVADLAELDTVVCDDGLKPTVVDQLVGGTTNLLLARLMT